MYIQNNGELRILTKEQMKRFLKFLVGIDFVRTLAQARKLTESPKKCYQTFLQVIDFININYNQPDAEKLVDKFSVSDIFDAYAVDDDGEDSNQIYDKSDFSLNPISDKPAVGLPESNRISDKVGDRFSPSNLIDDKPFQVERLLSNQIYNKTENDAAPSNQIYDKRPPRGKQKEPLKVPFLVRLDSVQLQGLKALGGNTNQHIRRAVEEYLSNLNSK